MLKLPQTPNTEQAGVIEWIETCPTKTIYYREQKVIDIYICTIDQLLLKHNVIAIHTHTQPIINYRNNPKKHAKQLIINMAATYV